MFVVWPRSGSYWCGRFCFRPLLWKVCSKIVVGGSLVVHGLRFDQGVVRIVVVCYIVNHYV